MCAGPGFWAPPGPQAVHPGRREVPLLEEGPVPHPGPPRDPRERLDPEDLQGRGQDEGGDPPGPEQAARDAGEGQGRERCGAGRWGAPRGNCWGAPYWALSEKGLSGLGQDNNFREHSRITKPKLGI